MRKFEKAALLTAAVLMICGASSCSKKTANTDSSGSGVWDAAVLSITYTGQPIADNAQAKIEMEKITNSRIKFTWVSNSNYEDKLNTMMASGTLPAIVVLTGLSSSVVNNIRAGAFWDITDEIQNYEYLKQTSPITINNLKIDGRLYGLPRSRPVARNGITYRYDWAVKAGIPEPKTTEDIYQLLKYFTEGDPDGNGKKDTYGMTWCKYDGPLDIITTWFGGGNQWVEQDGKYVPYMFTQGYMDAMNFARRLYQEGLVNDDFASRDTAIWADDINSGKSGMYIDVSDQARRTDNALLQLDKEKYAGAIWVVNSVSSPAGLYNLPTAGYAGMVAVSKSGAKTQEEMRKALNFIDRTNTTGAMNLFTYGVPGVHFDIVDGYAVRRTDLPEAEASIRVNEGFDQFMTNVTNNATPEKFDRIRQRVFDVQNNSDMSILVANPCITFSASSQVYSEKGSDLDTIRRDARIQYIVGQIDEAGWRAAMETWKTAGGQALIDEYNSIKK
ncbi:MAG: extracellular solute-binding protein [Treponema sp.]|nr:extracellular solute-binding protein [Treponema sp.]